MEQKTDLSREFGLLPDRIGQEFGSAPAVLDPKTDPSLEFSPPPDREAGEVSVYQEFAHDADAEFTEKKPSRKERHRRTLLLQMAAIGLSAVVVTSSFGQDILGNDQLFSDSGGASSGSSVSRIVIEAIDEVSKYDEHDSLNTTEYVIYEDGLCTPSPYDDVARYDARSNTLYLGAGQLDMLRIDNMGGDFTIYLEDTCYIGLIECFSGSLTITGTPGAALLINQHDEYVYWWHGLILYGNGTNAVLTVEPGITVDICGDGAIAIDNTTAPNAIRYDKTLTTLSGTVQSGAFIFESGWFEDEDGAPDWTVVDEQGNEAEHVVFSSGPYDPGSVTPKPGQSTPPYQPDGPDLSGLSTIPRLTITDTEGNLYEIWEARNFGDGYSSCRDLATYDPASNTLTIGGAPLEKIEVNAMGNDFTIHVEQDVSVGMISSTAYQDDGSITFTGENTLLVVNEYMTYAYGIFLDAAGGVCYLQVDPGISISAAGYEAAIAVSNTQSVPGLIYSFDATYLYEPLSTDDFNFPSNAARLDDCFDTTLIDEKDPFQGPSTYAFIEGFYVESESELPNEDPLPMPTEPGNIILELTENGEAVYLVSGGVPTGHDARVGGVSYDPDTRTLTLTDFTGYLLHIQDLPRVTIELHGSNELAQIRSNSALTIDGDPYAELLVNKASRFAYGITLSAEGADRNLEINWGPRIEVYGSSSAVVVRSSSSAQGIRLGKDVTLSGELVYGSFSGDGASPLSGMRTWVVMEPSEISPGTHVIFSRDYDHDPAAESRLTITVDGIPTVLFENGRPTETLWPSGVDYLFEGNTLVLEQVTFDSIDAYSMGGGFTIELHGANYGEHISVTGSRGGTDGSLTLNGAHFTSGTGYGSLILSTETYANAILVEANNCASTLDLGWVETLYLSAPEAAVMVRNTSAGTGLTTSTISSSTVSSSGKDWSFTDYETGELSTVYDGFGGFGGGGDYVILNGISVWDFPSYDAQRWIIANYYQNIYVTPADEYVTVDTVDGMMYNEATNTLTLTNCTARSLEAVLMGNDFTIRLVGDNYLGELLINAGNVTFAGSGTLTIDGGLYGGSRGLYLDAQNREHQIVVENGVTLRVSGRIYVHATTSRDPVVLGSGVSTEAVLAKNHMSYTSYNVQTDFASGAANYSFIEYGRSDGDFTEYIHSPYITIFSN